MDTIIIISSLIVLLAIIYQAVRSKLTQYNLSHLVLSWVQGNLINLRLNQTSHVILFKTLFIIFVCLGILSFVALIFNLIRTYKRPS